MVSTTVVALATPLLALKPGANPWPEAWLLSGPAECARSLGLPGTELWLELLGRAAAKTEGSVPSLQERFSRIGRSALPLVGERVGSPTSLKSCTAMHTV